LRVEDHWQTLVHLYMQRTQRIRRLLRAPHDLNQILHEPESSLKRRQVQLVAYSFLAKIAHDSHCLQSGPAFSQHQRVCVDVCWEGFVGEVVCVEVVCGISDLVERGDVAVEGAVGVVAFEPEGAAVVGVGGAGGVLFLAVVDDGDA
jgi:hypothetical protein